ncbi:tetratricopeptide repeat protein [Azospirillum sp. SYSU D00513]|uniref:tetratricopeptide repeat protein n=1 Tax=Azospirillum sp. SYSU D00513 TaxID=2812561 RepID=UPI0032B52AA0
MATDERNDPQNGGLAAVRDLLDRRHFKAALRLLDSGELRDMPEHDLLRAAALLGRRRNEEGLRHLRRALARRPDGVEAMSGLGQALLQTNDVLAAVGWFERALAVAPDHPGGPAALAQACRRDARYEDAIRIVDAQPGAAGDVDLLYEKAISQSYLGDAAGALATYEALLSLDPEHAAAWFGSHAPALQTLGMEEALRRLWRAVGCSGANGRYWAFLCAYHRLLGQEAEAVRIFREHVAGNPKRLPLVESVTAVQPHLSADTRIFGMSANLLRHALSRAAVPGMVLEFGVRRGTSINHIAAVAGQAVHGFDSFEGLPETWVNGPQGLLSTGRQLPPVRPNVTLHAGWFEDTLGSFLRERGEPLRFVNIDSDIYSSARTVLTALAPRVRPGTVLVFDEYIGNRTWREDEHKAFQEFVRDQGVAYQCFAISPFTKQVAVRIDAIRGETGQAGADAERTG